MLNAVERLLALDIGLNLEMPVLLQQADPVLVDALTCMLCTRYRCSVIYPR